MAEAAASLSAIEEAQRVGKRVKKLRRERGITQPELASYLEISQSNVSNIEIGRVLLTLPHLFKLKQLFNCPMSDFFEEDNTKPASKEELRLDVNDAIKLLKLLKHAEIEGL